MFSRVFFSALLLAFSAVPFLSSQPQDLPSPPMPEAGNKEDTSSYALLVASSSRVVPAPENQAPFFSSVPVSGTTAIAAPANLSTGVNIVYPYENLKIPQVSKTFIFGNIKPSTGALKINGESVKVHSNGAFIAYLPVKEGLFAFEAEVSDGISVSTTARRIQVAERKQPEISTSTLYLQMLSPLFSLELMSGDYINIAARGTPGQKMVYEIEDLAEGEMEESPPGSGFYYGAYRVRESDRSADSNITLRFKKGLFSHNVKLVSPNRVKVRGSAFTLKTSTDGVVLKNDPSGGYSVFLSSGVKLFSTGKAGSMYRVKMGDQTLWVSDSVADFVSDKIKKPRTETGNMVISSNGRNGVSAKLAVYEKVPYSVYEQEGSLVLTLYYANLHTNWVIYDSSDVFIKNVNFRQLGEDAAQFVFNFSEGKKLWGYDLNYSSSNSLVLDFKFRPEFSGKMPRPLEGLKLILDSGHSPRREPPFDGAVGPMGSFEYEVNMKITLKLGDKLASLGAEVFMVRQGEENIPLAARPLFARQAGGDLYISVHNNAIADGEDPFSKPRGFQIYYNQNHSMELARHIHRAFLKNIPLPDEGLRYGDYHVIRQTYMPAVLVENAYMIMPEQEEMLNDEKWQDRFAETIKKGILDFLGVKN